MPKYEIKNIRPGNKKDAAYKGQPDRSHILYAEVYQDDVSIISADLNYCVAGVKEMIKLDYQAEIVAAMLNPDEK
jgi:hypothetical protein